MKIALVIFRLSFYERMRDIVPPDFEPLLPEKPEPKFKYATEKSSMISNFFLLQYLTHQQTLMRILYNSYRFINITLST